MDSKEKWRRLTRGVEDAGCSRRGNWWVRNDVYGVRETMNQIFSRSSLITHHFLHFKTHRRFNKILEAHELLEEGEGNIAGGAVALLGDMNFQNAFVLARLVHFRPVQEHDRVGVLLDGAGLAKVGQSRLVIGAVFGAAVDLSQGHDGNLQLAGQ